MPRQPHVGARRDSGSGKLKHRHDMALASSIKTPLTSSSASKRRSARVSRVARSPNRVYQNAVNAPHQRAIATRPVSNAARNEFQLSVSTWYCSGREKRRSIRAWYSPLTQMLAWLARREQRACALSNVNINKSITAARNVAARYRRCMPGGVYQHLWHRHYRSRCSANAPGALAPAPPGGSKACCGRVVLNIKGGNARMCARTAGNALKRAASRARKCAQQAPIKLFVN